MCELSMPETAELRSITLSVEFLGFGGVRWLGRSRIKHVMNSRIHLKPLQHFLCWNWPTHWSVHCWIHHKGFSLFHMTESGFSKKRQSVCEGPFRHQLWPLPSPQRTLAPCLPWDLQMCQVSGFFFFLLSSSFGLWSGLEGLCNSFSVFEVRKQPSPRLWAFQLSVQPKPIREPKSAEDKHWFWFWHISQCITQECFLMQRGVCNPVIFKNTH